LQSRSDAEILTERESDEVAGARLIEGCRRMSNLKSAFRIASIVVYIIAAVAFAFLYRETSAMTGFCVVAAVLIGCGSVPARPGRPVTLYGAFGLLVGHAFWLFVSAINQGMYLGLIPAVLTAVGAVWMMQNPTWPSVIFSGAVGVLNLALAGLQFQHRFDATLSDPDTIRRTVLTSVVVLVVGLVFLAVGFTEMVMLKAAKSKRAARSADAARARRVDYEL
jgi:hypothetical protein